jgi:membrane protein
MIAHQQRTPLWAAAFSGAVLVLAGFTRPAPREHPPGARSSERSLNETSGGSRGEGATSPTQIPAAGWKDIARRIFSGISEDRVLAIAGGVTFFVLLAIFPGIAGLISLYGLFSDPSAVAKHLNSLSGVLPEGGMQIIRDQVDRLTSQPSQTLGLAMIAGLAISLWSANGGMKAMFDALNAVYHEKEKRGFVRLNAISLALTLGAVGFIILSLVTITVVPIAMDYLGLSQSVGLLVKFLRWPLLLLVASLFIAIIYRFGPSRDKPKWRWISPGSLFAAAGWLAASLLFSWYAENFGSFNKTYGSLGAVIGFMTWLWLSTIVILVGAKLNAEMEHQTAPDSTERPVPLRSGAVAESR